MSRRLLISAASLCLFFATGCPEEPAGNGNADTAGATYDVADTTAPEDTGGEDTATADTTGEDTAEPDAEDASDTEPTDTSAEDAGDTAADTEAPDVAPDTTDTADAAGSDTSDTSTLDDAGDTGPDASLGQCGGLAGKTCASDEWCDYPKNTCGGADQIGYCKKKPQICNKKYDPVCGCDGKTYSNECMANIAGVDIKSKGKCSAGSCGGMVCTKSEYCEYPKMQCSGSGTCQTKPTYCPALYDPVCGCDDKTYSNSCKANAAGVSVASKGKCSSGTGSCGGTTCSSKEYCDYATMQCGGKGSCKPRPKLCPSVYKPVCGCDGMTYSNECVAHSKGASVASTGKCSP